MKRAGKRQRKSTEYNRQWRKKIVCYNLKLLCLFAVCYKIPYTKSTHRRSHARLDVKEWKDERERVEKNRLWKWDGWTLTRHSPHIMPSETFMKRTQDEVKRKNEENSRMLLIFAHRSMMTTLKDISYCLWVSAKRNIEQGKRLKHTPFTKPYISIAFFIGHLDTPGWNVGIACLKLMHQLSSSPSFHRQ